MAQAVTLFGTIWPVASVRATTRELSQNERRNCPVDRTIRRLPQNERRDCPFYGTTPELPQYEAARSTLTSGAHQGRPSFAKG